MKRELRKTVAGVGITAIVVANTISATPRVSANSVPYEVVIQNDGVTEATPEVATDSAVYSRVVTLGADLNKQQRKMILKFFGITSDDDVIIEEITNKDERKYLEGIIDDSVIGTKTFSCAYILPTDEGGIIVKTANLNWVNGDMIKNALLTSGITNCQVLATAPFEVSGTGALTGVFKAYEKSTGTELDETKKELANEELATTLELSDNYGDEGVAVLNEAKANIMLSEKDDITEEDIQEVISTAAQNNGIELNEEDTQKLVGLMKTMSTQEYDVEKLQGSLGSYATDILEAKKGFFGTIASFFGDLFSAIGGFFSDIFGGGSSTEQPATTPEATTGESIFDNLDNSEVQLDETPTPTESVDGTNAEVTTDAPVETPDLEDKVTQAPLQESATVGTGTEAEETTEPESQEAFNLEDALTQ